MIAVFMAIGMYILNLNHSMQNNQGDYIEVREKSRAPGADHSHLCVVDEIAFQKKHVGGN